MEKMFNRKTNKEKDEEFYGKLPLQKKMFNRKIINLDIDDLVLKDGESVPIVKLMGKNKFAEYCLKTKNIELFKKTVDQKLLNFNNLGYCHLIMPQFIDFYTYAYAGYPEFDHDSCKYKKYIEEHASNLLLHGYYKELRFLRLKKFFLTHDQEMSILKSKRRDLIDNCLLQIDIQMNCVDLIREKNFDL